MPYNGLKMYLSILILPQALSVAVMRIERLTKQKKGGDLTSLRVNIVSTSFVACTGTPVNVNDVLFNQTNVSYVA